MTTTTNPTSKNTTLIPQETEQIVLKPVSSIENIIGAYREYNRLKDSLLIESDYQLIKGKKYIKKPGLRKLATAFGISTEIVRENRINFEKYFVYEITVRATSPSGRYAEACSSCASNEKEFSHLENDVRATAQTRGTNRAIADLIGSGEVSAEELDQAQPISNKIQEVTQKVKPEKVDNQNLEDSEPHMNGFVHKNNTTYTTPELMTVKQKNYLIKLIEVRYQDESTRATLFNRLNFLTKNEARDAIGKMLAV